MTRRVQPAFGRRSEDGHDLSMLWWAPPTELRAVSTALLGGGLGSLRWFLNAQVAADYGRLDPVEHVAALARSAGLRGPGAGMLTAVDVTTVEYAADGGVEVLATVGLGWPTWAAAPEPPVPPVAHVAGTINLLVVLPAPVGDAALVNLLATATEAKAQALWDAGVQGTGTASDAVCVAAPRLPAPGAARAGPAAGAIGRSDTADDDGRDRYGGPRSYWGSRVARAVHAAVRHGAAADWDRAVAGGWPRPPRQGGDGERHPADG